ncbi:STAS domain-containing protein [Blastococcus sp. SYSU DS0617]
MAESAAQSPGQENETEPQVRAAVDGDVVSVTVEGELTEAARRPLVRILTEELLSKQPLRRVELHLAGVPFMSSAGIAVLVQLQRMAAPRGVDVALVTPSTAVARPLQLTGLWHRFPIVDASGNEDPADHSTAGPDGSPREHA